MKAYKGFNKDMTCRGFQFEEGKTYEEDRAELCKAGFHACENPMNCMGYYNPAESVYHEVELEDVSPERNGDTKICGKKIKIGARLSIPKFVELSIQYMKEHCSDGGKKKASNTGDLSMASNTGDLSMASNTGNWSMASNTGDRSMASNTGVESMASNTGVESMASNTGVESIASNTGDRSMASNTGNWSMASNTGDRSMASNTGVESMASVEGKDSIAVASGYHCKAKACKGSAICLVERGKWNGKTYPLLAVKAAIVDGETIKADTWYKLENGEFVEVGE